MATTTPVAHAVDAMLHLAVVYDAQGLSNTTIAEDCQAIAAAGFTGLRVRANCWPEQPATQKETTTLEFILAAAATAQLQVVVAVPAAVADDQLQDWAKRLAAHGPLLAWELSVPSDATVDADWVAWLESAYADGAAVVKAWALRCAWSRQATIAELAKAELPDNPHRAMDWRAYCAHQAAAQLTQRAALLRAGNQQALVIAAAGHTYLRPGDIPAGIDGWACDASSALSGSATGRPGKGLAHGAGRRYQQRLWATDQAATVATRQPVAPPGAHALATLQAMGHGCNLVAAQQWREAVGNRERFRPALLAPWQKTSRALQEMSKLAQAISPHAAAIAESTPVVDVARVTAPCAVLAAEIEPWISQYIGPLTSGRQALATLDFNEDGIVAAELDERYQVALVPYAMALDEADCQHLKTFAEGGGVVVVGPLAGQLTRHLRRPWTAPPGALQPLTRTRIEEATPWQGGDLAIHGIAGGGTLPAGHWAEVIAADDEQTVVRARYASGWLAGRPALCERALGRGRVLHVGVGLSDGILAWLWQECQLPVPDLALRVYIPGAEVLARQHAQRRYYFALNHAEGPAVFELRRPLRDLLTGQAVTGPFTLESRCWRVLEETLRSDDTVGDEV